MTYSLILRRTLLAASAAALCLPAMAELADIKSAGKLRVGIDFGAPFYGYVDDKMKPVGSDVEAAELLAKDLGLQLEIVNTTNSARIPNLLSNKVDLIISSLSITPERQKAVDFSIPYGAIQAAVGAPKSMKLTGIEDLAGKTVAVTRGGPQDKIVTERAPHRPRSCVLTTKLRPSPQPPPARPTSWPSRRRSLPPSPRRTHRATLKPSSSCSPTSWVWPCARTSPN